VKILYIEDNDDNVYVMRNRLGRAGFTVVVAGDAEQGLARAAAERPDLILMDLGLPGIAHAMAGDREKALAAGCDDHDTKPIDFARLRAKIQRLVPEDPPRSSR
jgi:CheY-like chemotaxis protein